MVKVFNPVNNSQKRLVPAKYTYSVFEPAYNKSDNPVGFRMFLFGGIHSNHQIAEILNNTSRMTR